jgi:hypothetical protein
MANKITYNDKVIKGDPLAVPGVTDAWRSVDSNEVKQVVNANADTLEAMANSVAELDMIVNPLTASLSVSPNIAEVGSTVNVTLNWSYNMDITSQSMTKNSANFPIALADRSKADSLTASTPSTFTYALSAAKNLKTKTASASVNFVYASYHGIVSSLTPSASDILALTKVVKNGKGYTVNGINLTNARYAYAYPVSFGALTAIKDANNFEYLQSYTQTTININGVSYYLYVLTSPVTISNFRQAYS